VVTPCHLTRQSRSVASRAPGVEDSAVVMRRTPGGVSPFTARVVDTASSPLRPAGISGDPGLFLHSNAEDTRVSFDGPSVDANDASKQNAGPAVTPREAAINLANCIMGAGALSLPAFFKSTGAILGVGLLLASCAWTWFSAVMMVKAADVVSIRVLNGVPVSSYEELMDLTLGRNGRWISAVGILLLQIGCLVGYANILADVVSPFAIDILPPGLEPNRGAVLTAVTFGAMLPIGIAVGGDGSSPALAAVSKASIVIVGIFASLLSVCGAAKTLETAYELKGIRSTAGVVTSTVGNGAAGGTADGTYAVTNANMNDVSYQKNEVTFFQFSGTLHVLPLAIFAFGAHPAILPITRAMRPSGLIPSVGVVTSVLSVCVFSYIMIGLGGYLAFRNDTAGNVLRNMDGDLLGNFGSKSLKFGYGLVILASVPTILLPLQKSARDVYLRIIPLIVPPAANDPARGVLGALRRSASGGGGLSGAAGTTHLKAQTRRRRRSSSRDVADDLGGVPPEIANRLATVVALICMTCALCLSVYVPNVAFAFGLTGSTCSFLIAFALPAASFLSVTAAGQRRRGDGASNAAGGGKQPDELANGAVLLKGAQSGTDALVLLGGGGASGAAGREDGALRRSRSQNAEGEKKSSGWAWTGDEDPDSDTREDDVSVLGEREVDRARALFESTTNSTTPSRAGDGGGAGDDCFGNANAIGTRSSVSPSRKSKGASKHASTRAWRLGAKVQIAVSMFLSITCTREVARELKRENALVTVVSKMADARISADAINKESASVKDAKEKFVGASAALAEVSRDAEKSLGDVHRTRKALPLDWKALPLEASTSTVDARLIEAISGPSLENANPELLLSEIGSSNARGEGGTPRAPETISIPESNARAVPAIASNESLEKIKRLEAVSINTTAAKAALEDAMKHSDDEVRRVSGKSDAREGGKALDEERKETQPEEDALDAEQNAADIEAKRLASGDAASSGVARNSSERVSGKLSEERDAPKTPSAAAAAAAANETSLVSKDDSRASDDLTAATAASVVRMADEKLGELDDAKAKVVTEAERALETAVFAEGVDEIRAKDLASALANLTGGRR